MESGSALSEEFGLLREHLGRLSDHRLRRGLVHPLEGVLSLTALGLMCGCPSLSAIYRFGDMHPQLLTRLGLRRSPSVQTCPVCWGWCQWGRCARRYWNL